MFWILIGFRHDLVLARS